jgi:uncharacterized protein DUF3604
MNTRRFSAIALALALVAAPVTAQDIGAPDPEQLRNVTPKRPYSPYAGRAFATRVFWGDTHLHTGFSMDAGAFGARLAPADAYRFAKGQEIVASSGQPVKLSRPLDFLVVTDHSDGMGFFPIVMSGSPAVLADPQGRRWYEMIQSGDGGTAAIEIIRTFGLNQMPKSIFPAPGTQPYRDAWEQTIKAAEDANDPGRFTAFIGYEWTSNAGGNNLHRNVIYRDDASKASQAEPFTTLPPLGSPNPVDLWKWMTDFEAKTGGRVLAIAHNGNLSNGRMFPIIESFTGRRVTREYVETRAKWEPLYEVTQIKGDGEAHPTLSPTDEFANFEIWDKGNLDLSEDKSPAMIEFEYARSALRNGLRLERDLGTNPYKFGMIASTDAHTGLTAVEEENFFGKTTTGEPSAERGHHPFVNNPRGGPPIMGWETIAAGYAGVWATDNTREALFDAMQRKEAYGTTGPRMVLRFFGGWEFEARDAQNRLPAEIGYSKGVPMGGDLRAAPAGKAPSFLVAALKDPIGANLDRIQIVKGWLDAKGDTHEQVYDVVWSGNRAKGADGKVPAVGNTVDIPNATWTNTIGAPELISVWTDPSFDATQRAFYYVRVLEIPTPRWTAYDAKYYGVRFGPEVRMVQQERAYSSPIWYTP